MVGSGSSHGFSKRKHQQYNDYSAKERAEIAWYAAENGVTKACRYLSKILGKTIPEATAQRLKSEYLTELQSKIQVSAETEGSQGIEPVYLFYPRKFLGGPFFLEMNLMSVFENLLNL